MGGKGGAGREESPAWQPGQHSCALGADRWGGGRAGQQRARASHQHLPRTRLGGEGPGVHPGDAGGQGCPGPTPTPFSFSKAEARLSPRIRRPRTCVLLYAQKTELRRGEKRKRKGGATRTRTPEAPGVGWRPELPPPPPLPRRPAFSLRTRGSPSVSPSSPVPTEKEGTSVSGFPRRHPWALIRVPLTPTCSWGRTALCSRAPG